VPWKVVVAVCVGIIIGGFADSWASDQIDRLRNKTPTLGKISESRQVLLGSGILALRFTCFGGLACLGYFSERRRWWARHALQSNMRLSLLQAQIEPHFLFNSLAAIRPLIRQDGAQAERVLDALCHHLRATLPQMREEGASTLGQQLDLCASYLEVMEARMGTRLQHETHVAEELRSVEFPPLILLSLVENAIQHGLEPKPGPGRLTIEAGLDSTCLRVAVLDDGVGLRDGLQSGVGLANIREQLQLRFGEKASLSIATRPGGGTVAAITLPWVQPAESSKSPLGILRCSELPR
jgi:sensor histidine kinase YesM